MRTQQHRNHARTIKQAQKVIDLRSPVAFRDGHIDGAVNMSLRALTSMILEQDKNQHIVLIGDDEEIVAAATRILTGYGFSHVAVTSYPVIPVETRTTKRHKRSESF